MTARVTRPRKATRLLALTGACGLAVLSLSGCIKVEANLTINSDATGSGTFAFEVQKDAAQFLGISDLSTFESQLTEGDLSKEGIGNFGTCESSESDTGFVYSCSFTDESFTAEDGPWTVKKDGNSIVFHMVTASQSDTEASDASALLGDSSFGDVTIDVTFPGAITAITGDGAEKTSDTTATIKGSLTDTLDVTITSESTSSGFSKAALLTVLVGLAILALIVIVVVVLLMRRRRAAAAEPSVAAEAVATDVADSHAASVAPATDAVVADSEADAPTVVAQAVPEPTMPAEPAPEPTMPAEPAPEPTTPPEPAPEPTTPAEPPEPGASSDTTTGEQT